MKDSGYAYSYAVDVVESEWKEAEPYIMKNKHWWYEYHKYFGI